MQQLLSNLEKHRWDWAHRGVEDFRKGFLRLKETTKQKGRVLIGIYGPTQVGKTTLILKLLGIREEMMTPFSKALRGSRKYGNSATVTSTIYQQSPDDAFYLIRPDGRKVTCKTLQELAAGMEQLRADVEGGRLSEVKPLTLQIAKSLFQLEELDKRKQTIEILDLPGDDSREKLEVEHVNRCLEEYLPHCRLCIVMESASHLISLTQLKRENVSDWMLLPHKYIIVLSKALSSASVKEKVRNQEFSSASAFQNHFKGEIKRGTKENIDEAKVYPLDFGDTWEQIKREDPELHERTAAWMNELLQQLTADLSSVYTPENELKNLKSMEGLIQKKKKEHYDQLQKEKEEITEKISDLEVSQKVIKQKMDDIEIEQEDLRGLEELISSLSFKQPAVGYIPGWDARIGNERNATELSSDFYYQAEQLDKAYRTTVNYWNQDLKLRLTEKEIPFKPIKYEFPKLTIGLVNYYIIQKYFKRTTFDEDLGICMDKLQKANNEVFQAVKLEVDKQIKQIQTTIKNRTASLQNRVTELIAEQKKNAETLKKLQRDLAGKDVTMERAKSEWDSDIERSKQLNLYLKKAFVEEVNTLQYKLVSPETSTPEKWAYHQYWNIITADVERIIKDAPKQSGEIIQ
jgi:hypothetical protein